MNEELAKIRKAADKIEGVQSRNKTKPTVELGICESCVYCNGYERDLGVSFYRCDVFDRAFDFRKPKIVRCRSHAKRGTLDINSLFNMAYLIERDKKTVLGFAERTLEDDMYESCVPLEECR